MKSIINWLEEKKEKKIEKPEQAREEKKIINLNILNVKLQHMWRELKLNYRELFFIFQIKDVPGDFITPIKTFVTKKKIQIIKHKSAVHISEEKKKK